MWIKSRYILFRLFVNALRLITMRIVRPKVCWVIPISEQIYGFVVDHLILMLLRCYHCHHNCGV